ncbi:MAG TPA: sulfide/dihydroorotate dehydrogenase-like FAD/NAD-binding protein [Candidatus Sumerlaeota bacterium]|nr:sulfide/dihydroorotate dehydrogenase-like FAD/NAD-binding protein [Candidatus Sumerlaeota bacterium]HPS02292.1 sulfide/dihydroorotate dehydrogenase-like FAD/NAD-binding protein [Candidatus Sumerlaeota bacterium]
MYKVLERHELAEKIVHLVIEFPELARKRRAGQFLILRANERSERIPLSIAGADAERGTLDLVVQEVGKSSAEVCAKKPGDTILDVVGPLGMPTHIENFGTAVCVGGGLGIAPLYPIAKALHEAGNYVISILGARSREFMIFEERIRSISDQVICCTDDGSYGTKGVVTQPLKEMLEAGGIETPEGKRPVNFCITVGPPIMMRFVAETTRPFAVPTFASLNTLMVDGTGMCGGCRVTVGGETKYVCVDGPEFDAHQVDFPEMMRRMAMYKEFERRSYEHFRKKAEDDHVCKLANL